MGKQTTQTETVTSLEHLETVVDSDFHLSEQQDDFLSYLPSPFHDMLFHESRDIPMGYLKDFYPTAGLLTPVATGNVEMNKVRSQADIIEGKDLLNVDRAIVTPTLNLYLGGVHHDDLAAALAHAYNEWVLDEIYNPDEGIYGPVVVAPQKPQEAAAEIEDRAGEDGIVSVFIPSGGVHPPLGNEQYFPIYAAAENAGLPVQLHSASGTQMLSFPLQFHGSNRYLSNHAPTHAMVHMTHLTDMITRGVPVRFPDLDIVFQEAGLGWVPYMTRRLDNEYSEKRSDAPMLEKMPSEYVDDQFYFTSQPVEGAKDPDYIGPIVGLMGPDNLMFSSDYPHLDFDHSDYLFSALRSNFESSDVANVYGQTALEIYDF
ncbi:amidohydrolase family protein [Haloplanus pelagicus]|jgi:predicted TIM-barrel fold metal-dependent hydrolase|uniref:amidohydrolase family protein n=1 Tax=Haloplanus pelagicus TaxID=2949995 RepID=UPI002040C638|nr:amidohydrolase family protein [Haloplanus sp. HW8-1]